MSPAYLLLPALCSLALAVDNHDYDHDHDHEHHAPGHWGHPTTQLPRRTGPLICNCTVGASKFCDAAGTCNANLVASKLKAGLRNAQIIVDSMSNHPGHEQIMSRLCSAISSVQDPTDIQILDFVLDWEPSCVQSGTFHSCSLAPIAETSPTKHSSIDKERLNPLMEAFFDHLQCDKVRFPPPQLQRDWVVCRHESFCNSQLSHEEAAALASSASFLPPLYILVPAIAGGIILIAAFVALGVCVAKRSGPKRRTVVHGSQSLQV